jgi:type II secretory pathway predicted ATPase ExeA
MYRKHFAFTRFPFETERDPDALFASSALSEAHARLNHLLELRGIGLITGEVGSGKTTICRKAASALHPGLYRLFYVPLSTGHVMDMYKSIAWELGLPIERNRASAYRLIRTEISRLTLEAKQRPVLIVDEAHHLRNEVLEDLRLLTNYEMDSENRLCLLLVGLTELRRRLSMAVHESLAQRIVVRHHLRGLTREELPHYLAHRLHLAGCELPVFEPASIEALFQATQGLPRKVNRLAHYALSAAALTKAKAVTCDHVQAALDEITP